MLRWNLQLAWRTLSAYRLRSALTVLAIAIGVTGVIVLVSLAQSGYATLVQGIEKVGGTRFIMVWHDNPKKAALKQADYLDGLTLADARALAESIPGISRVAPLISSEGTYYAHRRGGTNVDCDRIGADPEFLQANALSLAKGRNLDAADLSQERQVCLLGTDLATKLFGSHHALDQDIVLSGQRYTVVGVLAYAPMDGASFGFDKNNVAIVPITVLSPQGRVSYITMTSLDSSRNTDVINRANAILLARHNGVDDFQFIDFGGMLKNFVMVLTGMIAVVGLVAGVSLLIGGVGIMNIMLVAVQERRREIGVRKALGATSGEIMGQFLVEAMVLGLVGALAGSAVGVGIAGAAMWLGPVIHKGWVGVISLPAVVLAVVAAGGTGLFFGWYPARRAALLDPIVCLRSE